MDYAARMGKRITAISDDFMAALAELRFHDLRRSAVRNMDRAGVPRTSP